MSEQEYRIILAAVEPGTTHEVAPTLADLFGIGIPQSERVLHKAPVCLLGNLSLDDALLLLSKLRPMIEAGAGVTVQPHGRLPVRTLAWPQPPAILSSIRPVESKGVLTHCPGCQGAVQFPLATLNKLQAQGRTQLKARCPRCGQTSPYDLNRLLDTGAAPARAKAAPAPEPEPPAPLRAAPAPLPPAAPEKKAEPSKHDSAFLMLGEDVGGAEAEESLFLDELEPLSNHGVSARKLSDIVEFESGMIDLYATEADDLDNP